MERVLHHSYRGKDYAQQSEVRSASVDKLPTDEVPTDKKIIMKEVCSSTWRLMDR